MGFLCEIRAPLFLLSQMPSEVESPPFSLASKRAQPWSNLDLLQGQQQSPHKPLTWGKKIKKFRPFLHLIFKSSGSSKSTLINTATTAYPQVPLPAGRLPALDLCLILCCVNLISVVSLWLSRFSWFLTLSLWFFCGFFGFLLASLWVFCGSVRFLCVLKIAEKPERNHLVAQRNTEKPQRRDTGGPLLFGVASFHFIVPPLRGNVQGIAEFWVGVKSTPSSVHSIESLWSIGFCVSNCNSQQHKAPVSIFFALSNTKHPSTHHRTKLPTTQSPQNKTPMNSPDNTKPLEPKEAGAGWGTIGGKIGRYYYCNMCLVCFVFFPEFGCVCFACDTKHYDFAVGCVCFACDTKQLTSGAVCFVSQAEQPPKALCLFCISKSKRPVPPCGVCFVLSVGVFTVTLLITIEVRPL